MCLSIVEHILSGRWRRCVRTAKFMLDRGEKKGLETGKYKTYYDLISDGTLTLKQAAEKCSLSPDEFQKKLIELKIIEG